MKPLDLARFRRANADDPHRIHWLLRPNDHDDSSPNRPDGNEAFLSVGRVLLVKDFELVGAAREQRLGIREAEAVLFVIRGILERVPVEPHSQV